MSRLEAEIVVERRSERGGEFRLEAAIAGDGITVVCGPSGAGKSTLLLALVGGLRPRSGRIALDGRPLFDAGRGVDLPTRRRRIGMVFQEAALFPHLDALRNVGFGIRGRERPARARAWLARVGAADLAHRLPSELSGGERQRIALARALAAEPRALLLDEPFSALDSASRAALGDLLVELQSASGIPFLHVTHDLGEALRLGTRLVLLERGAVVQSGIPAEVIARPASLAAARAVGTENVLSGAVLRHSAELGCSEVDLGGTVVQTCTLDLPPGARVTLGLRAEEVLIALGPLGASSARNVLEGRVETLVEVGTGVEARVATPVPLRALLTPGSVRELGLEPGTTVRLVIKASAFRRLA